MEPFIGQICLFGFNYAPRGWATCDGQIIPIAQNSALFALLGTTYGGNGQTTFALPDLRGRVAIHQGQGPGLSQHTMGEMSGSEQVTLLQTQMPQHNHLMQVSDQPASQSSPANHILAVPGVNGEPLSAYGTSPDAVADPRSIGMAGGNQPHQNMQPYLTMNYCIALEGVFPSRN